MNNSVSMYESRWVNVDVCPYTELNSLHMYNGGGGDISVQPTKCFSKPWTHASSINGHSLIKHGTHFDLYHRHDKVGSA